MLLLNIVYKMSFRNEMKNISIVLIIVMLTSCASMFKGPWKEHPVPNISKLEAIEIKKSYLMNKKETDNYSAQPEILDEFYVFQDNILCSLNSKIIFS